MELPIKAFCLNGYSEKIELTITEVLDFPNNTSFEGGYDVKGNLDIEIGSYTVHCKDFYFATGVLGYGTEMGKALLNFAFGTIGLRRIIAGCNAENIASYRIMEKIGMRREAHFIKAQHGNKELNVDWCDRFQYAILREEWQNSSIFVN